MLSTQSPSFAGSPAPRVYSAAALCKATAAGVGACGRLDDTGLDRTLCHDAKRGLLEVQAGTPWRSLGAFAGEAFLPGTVGASVTTNAAGPDGRPMVVHLRALTLATADGELRRASREVSPELFRLAVGGFGAFGPFYSITLDLASLSRAAANAAAPVRLELPQAGSPGAAFVAEVLVPPLSSERFIEQACASLEERRCRLTRLEVRRVLPEQETFLRWARRDFAAVHIEFRHNATLGASVSAAQARLRLYDLSLAAGGMPAPAQLPLASRAQAAASYPMLGAFLAEKRRLDPAERVLGAWYRDVRDLWRRERCDVRWSRG